MNNPEAHCRLKIPGVDMPVSLRLQGDPETAPLLVFGHGAGAGVDHPLQQALARACAAAGCALLRYQFPFMERQGGRGFGRDPRPQALATVRAAVAYAHHHWPAADLLGGGHSYGARITSLAAAEAPGLSVEALVLLSYPLHPPRRPAAARAAHWPAISKPMLMLSGSRDVMAQAPLLEQQMAGRPSSSKLVRIADADHGWQVPRRSNRDPFAAITGALAAWLRERA